jgi:hypothetical protein
MTYLIQNLPNTNIGIFGITRTGKTLLLKSLLAQAHQRGRTVIAFAWKAPDRPSSDLGTWSLSLGWQCYPHQSMPSTLDRSVPLVLSYTDGHDLQLLQTSSLTAALNTPNQPLTIAFDEFSPSLFPQVQEWLEEQNSNLRQVILVSQCFASLEDEWHTHLPVRLFSTKGLDGSEKHWLQRHKIRYPINPQQPWNILWNARRFGILPSKISRCDPFAWPEMDAILPQS